MSLARLLAAGKSVVGVTNDVSPYRVVDQRLLPKFGLNKTPLCPPKAGPASRPNPNPNPNLTVAATASGGSSPGRARRWAKRGFIGLFGWPDLKPKKSPGARLDRPVLQAELRLEHVKVVRNDLNESDLELVQLRPKAAATKPNGGGSGKHASSRLAAVRHLLEFFGAKRT